MKGVIFTKQGASPSITDYLPSPALGDDQILVRPIWAAINPVDSYMANYGLLVVDWPLVLGVDTAAVVVEVGKTAVDKFKIGDYVCGCTRLGSIGYNSVQEYHLMDASVTIPKPKNVDLQQSVTLGVGLLTAALGLYKGLGINTSYVLTSEWVLVLGGASSVGKFAIQLAIVSGYKVLASCSPASYEVVRELGAEPFDYKQDIQAQLKGVLDITGSNVHKVFDAVASDDPVLVKQLFQKIDGQKLFSTTNDWSGIQDFEGGKTACVELGPIGRPEHVELNKILEGYIPILVKLVEEGKVKPAQFHEVGTGGFEDAIKAYEYQKSGAGGSKKIIVKIQDE